MFKLAFHWIILYKITFNYQQNKPDEPVKSPKFRHACEGRHPEPFEITGFPPSRE